MRPEECTTLDYCVKNAHYKANKNSFKIMKSDEESYQSVENVKVLHLSQGNSTQLLCTTLLRSISRH